MTLQDLANAREDLNIRAYEVWQGWAQQYALAELEREVAKPSGWNPGAGYSPSPSRTWPFSLLIALICIGALIGLRFW
jgi:hypothetical protein